ncbi:MAG: F0F1 ATP synthase subunit epsilon [Thiohalomonadaceae bacterium]
MISSDKTFLLNIVSPEQRIYSGKVHVLAVLSVHGELGILPRHSPLLAKLRPGEARIQTEDMGQVYIYISGGYIEIQPDEVTILADTALRGEDIDEAAALAAKKRAERAIRTSPLYSERDQAHLELIKAIAQLKVLQHTRGKKINGL